MHKTLVWMALAAFALAVPAYAGADKPPGTGGQSGKQHGKSQDVHGKSHKCKAHSVGYVVGGTLVTDGLTQSAGQDTPNDASDDRYSGTVTLTVTHTNHWARKLTGQQTLTLTNVRVTLGDGVTQPPAPGSTVHVIGKVTAVAKKCKDQSAAGVVTFKKVVFALPSSDDSEQGD
jgi:hypothetical protein